MEHRFIKLGEPLDAARGLNFLLGIDDATAARFLQHQEDAIAAEFARAGAEDQENYRKVWNGLHVGDSQKTLDELLAHPDARQARLGRHHILALRVYTTSSFRCINAPMRLDPPTKPHPFAATVISINDGIRKLRAVPALRGDVLARRTFWRGVADLGLSQQFFTEGGTELACMSTSVSKEQASIFAGAHSPLMLKFTASSIMQLGADVAFLSARPAEGEFLYPPLTYLRPLGPARTEQFRGRAVLVADVEPEF